MLKVIHADTGIAFAGSSQDYLRLREQVLEFIASDETILRIRTEANFDPAPYDEVLTELVIIKSHSLLTALKENKRLLISGCPEFLHTLANNLPIPSTSIALPQNYHHHFDYIGWPEEIANTCPEMVFCLK
jgi:hypothetical protein